MTKAEVVAAAMWTPMLGGLSYILAVAPKQPMSDVVKVAIVTAVATFAGITVSSLFIYLGLRSGQKAATAEASRRADQAEAKIDTTVDQNRSLLDKTSAIGAATDGTLKDLQKQIAVLTERLAASEEKTAAVNAERDRIT